jgi:hypothetical protein
MMARTRNVLMPEWPDAKYRQGELLRQNGEATIEAIRDNRHRMCERGRECEKHR